jgi:hypothetical protein
VSRIGCFEYTNCFEKLHQNPFKNKKEGVEKGGGGKVKEGGNTFDGIAIVQYDLCHFCCYCKICVELN